MAGLKIKFSQTQIIVALFFLSLFSGYFWNHKFFFIPVPPGDEAQYSCIAQNIVKNKIYTNCYELHNVPREPMYPLFIAAIYAISDFNPDAVRLAQLILFALCSVMIYLLGKRLFGQRAGVAAGLFFSLWWGLANYTGRFTREILMAFLILILVNLLFRAQEEKKYIYFALAGFVLGVLALTNGVVKYIVVFLLLNFVYLLKKQIKTKRLVLSLSLFVFVFVSCLIPWSVYAKYQTKKTGEEIGVSLAGHVLLNRAVLMERLYPNFFKHCLGHLIGYYFIENIFPDLNIREFREDYPAPQRFPHLEQMGYSRSQIYKMYKQEAIPKIIKEPHKYLAMSFLDFLNLNSPLIPQRIFGGNSYAHFTFTNNQFPQIPAYLKMGVLAVFRLWWLGFLFLAGWGIFSNIKNWRRVSWLILFVFYFNAVYSAIHAIPRYITPVMPFYIIFASVGFWTIYNKLKFRKKYDSSQ